jgi:hypothetical protein
MFNRFFKPLLLGLMFFSLIAAGALRAEIIPVLDGDFESPVIDPAVYPYGQIYEDLSVLFPPWHVWQGALTNPTTLSAYGSQYGIEMTGHGDQVGYIFCGDPDAANKPYWYQELGATFEAGKEYTLSMTGAVIGGAATPGETLEMRLGYWNGETAAAGPTIIAQRLIASDEINAGWSDYSIKSDAISGDAVGKPIVVYISQGDNPYVTGPQYYFDNVQLTAVPEPSTLALLAFGLVGLLACALRKRK